METTRNMFCRLCAQEQQHTIPIFSDTSLNIDLILYHLLSIKVCRDDVLPTVICLECFRKTNFLNEFKTSVQQAQEIFKLLNITKTEIEMANVVKMEAVEPVIESNSVEPVIEESNLEIATITEIRKNDVKLEILMQDEDEDEQDSEPNGPSNKKLSRQKREEFKNLLCTDCDKIFRSVPLLTKHFVMRHHKPVQFKCSYCSQIYQKHRAFTRHVMTHVRTFSCEVCDRSFSHKTYLKTHLYSHIQDRTFECTDCHLKFKQLLVRLYFDLRFNRNL